MFKRLKGFSYLVFFLTQVEKSSPVQKGACLGKNVFHISHEVFTQTERFFAILQPCIPNKLDIKIVKMAKH